MIERAIQTFRAEPAMDDPPGPMPRDWVLVALVVIVGVFEAVFRTNVGWPFASLILVIVLAPTLLIRRTRPWLAMAATFGGFAALQVASLAGTEHSVGLGAAAFVLINVYAMFRWGSGQHALRSIWLMVGMLALTLITDWTGFAEAIGGTLVLAAPAEIGLVVRSRLTAQDRKAAQVRAEEREELARELHDTVAHHVSAIAIQAQAGRAVGANNHEASLQALATIEEEASRTLGEMRLMVSALRNRTAERLPQQGLADVAALAESGGGGPRVEVEISGELSGMAPAVDVALFRLAQESVTNARRHGRRVRRVRVVVMGDDGLVTLTVVDDGEAQHFGPLPPPPGFGLVGMTERAELLGGTLEAGPRPGGGWAVEATLPLNPQSRTVGVR